LSTSAICINGEPFLKLNETFFGSLKRAKFPKQYHWVAKFSVADPDLFWSDPVKIRPDPQHATPAK
jgi:hypothetical protein